MALDWLDDRMLCKDDIVELCEDWVDGTPMYVLCNRYKLTEIEINYYLSEVYLGGLKRDPTTITLKSKMNL